ncbi:unnamed protein product [Echinostoma caproni]|uniref:Tudor domain-containing protein n=1 Tax=Echinostoma caproni TaxID=27848 RepID=A0A183AM05_9TREM|nr:unnamed protein product [Echinostoma caproni]
MLSLVVPLTVYLSIGSICGAALQLYVLPRDSVIYKTVDREIQFCAGNPGSLCEAVSLKNVNCTIELVDNPNETSLYLVFKPRVVISNWPIGLYQISCRSRPQSSVTLNVIKLLLNDTVSYLDCAAAPARIRLIQNKPQWFRLCVRHLPVRAIWLRLMPQLKHVGFVTVNCQSDSSRLVIYQGFLHIPASRKLAGGKFLIRCGLDEWNKTLYVFGKCLVAVFALLGLFIPIYPYVSGLVCGFRVPVKTARSVREIVLFNLIQWLQNYVLLASHPPVTSVASTRPTTSAIDVYTGDRRLPHTEDKSEINHICALLNVKDYNGSILHWQRLTGNESFKTHPSAPAPSTHSILYLLGDQGQLDPSTFRCFMNMSNECHSKIVLMARVRVGKMITFEKLDRLQYFGENITCSSGHLPVQSQQLNIRVLLSSVPFPKIRGSSVSWDPLGRVSKRILIECEASLIYLGDVISREVEQFFTQVTSECSLSSSSEPDVDSPQH